MAYCSGTVCAVADIEVFAANSAGSFGSCHSVEGSSRDSACTHRWLLCAGFVVRNRSAVVVDGDGLVFAAVASEGGRMPSLRG
jgi:hypothetical protein